MADPKADSLLRAAQTGNVDRLRHCLAARASIEATDVNRMTPVMLAAQGGHVAAFQTLVEAGANLHALAFRQVDLLEVAVDGGNVEIVRYLLERGLPVNGHWQPLNETLRRLGHDMPLIRAVDSGQVEVVRVLLEAEADRSAKYRGQTALDTLQERLSDPDHADFQDAYRAIASLLGEEPAEKSRPAELATNEIADFAANAHRPECARLRERLSALCGGGQPWAPLSDHGQPAAEVVALTFPRCVRQKILDDLQRDARAAGCQLILAEPWEPGEAAQLVLQLPLENRSVEPALGRQFPVRQGSF